MATQHPEHPAQHSAQHPAQYPAPTGPVHVEPHPLGPYMTNGYIVRFGQGPTARGFIIDCGQSPRPLLESARAQLPRGPEAIVLTHAHHDHIEGLHEARSAFPGVPIWIHRAEADWLTDPRLNLSAWSGPPAIAPPADRLLDGGETLDLPGGPWLVRHTPGHSPGGIAIIRAGSEEGPAFVGDSLFAGSIGRSDFPGSDHHTLEASIRERLYTLPDRTVIYPGHGGPSTIGHERTTNPFVRG